MAPRHGSRPGEVGSRGHQGGIAGSEPKDDTGGGLSGVRCRAGMQCVRSKVWPFVHEAMIFGTLVL
jgi:hypothetical protein